MRLCGISVLAAGAAVALFLMPGRAGADLLPDTGSSVASQTERDAGWLGFEGGNNTILLGDTLPEMTSRFFSPDGSVPQNGVSKSDAGDSNDQDFISPRFLSFADGSLQHYGAQGLIDPVPEPSFALLMMCSMLVIAGRSRKISKAARR